MYRKILTGAAPLVALVLTLGLAAAVAAQNTAILRGKVIDQNGSPWASLTIRMTNDRGQTVETTTDAEGNFNQGGLSGGEWTLEFYVGDQKYWGTKVRLASGQDGNIGEINFKEMIEKNPEAMAAKKKREEEAANFENMKLHFDAGVAAMQQADSLQNSLAKTPADQKEAVQQQIAEVRQKAVTSFSEAEKLVGPKDPNRPLIVGNLGAALKTAGQYEEAIAAYGRAIAIKPEPGYYVGLAESQARTGKNEDAMATCGNIPGGNATHAATCYRNIGIVLYNASKLKEAAGPLRKATELDPKYADTWYLLGACLLASMESKQVGEKLEFVVQPGTAEAYATYLELAPEGRFATDAKAALQSLEALGAGVTTKMKVTKKKGS